MPKSRDAMRAAKRVPPPLKLECFIPTSDDWYSNFNESCEPDKNGGYVRLFAVKFVDSDGYRVGVWGADGTGMERDFSLAEKSEAMALYNLLKGCGAVSRADLNDMGMVPT